MATTTCELTSTQIRAVGNISFANYKSSKRNCQKVWHLHQALEWYDKALNTTRRRDHADKASALRNTAVCFKFLNEIELCYTTKIHYIKGSARKYSLALDHGERANKPTKWIMDIFEDLNTMVNKYITTSENLIENSLSQILPCIEHEIGLQNYHEMMARHRLDQGERILYKGLQLISERNFLKALPMVHDLYRPIEEARKHAHYNQDLMDEVAVMQEEYHKFHTLAKSVQNYHIGLTTLEIALKTKDVDKQLNLGILSIDQLSAAEVMVEGMDIELLAMINVKIGIANVFVFKSKSKGKQGFIEAIELAATLVGNVYDRKWYIEATQELQKIRDEEERIEKEKWETKRKVYLEELKTELTEIWSKEEESAIDLVDFLLEKYPPKHIKNFKKPTESSDKKLLLKVCALYHTDRVGEEKHGTKYKVLCEEISKLVNKRYQREKDIS